MLLGRAHCKDMIDGYGYDNDDRWTTKIVEWGPRYDAFRSRGGPPIRWHDDLRRIQSNCMKITLDRELWKQTMEAYVQQWTSVAGG